MQTTQFCIDMCEGAVQESTPDVEINIATSDTGIHLYSSMVLHSQDEGEDTPCALRQQHERHAVSVAPELLPCNKMLQQVIDKGLLHPKPVPLPTMTHVN